MNLMTDLNLTKLREIAVAATDGPWNLHTLRTDETHDIRGSIDDEANIVIYAECEDADADHIAAFDPPTVLALIDEIEWLRRIRADLTDIAVENNLNAGPYIPTTERILGWLCEGMGEYADVMEGWFARWLEAHDREVAAKALHLAADRLPAFHDRNAPEWAITSTFKWLHERADRIEAGDFDD